MDEQPPAPAAPTPVTPWWRGKRFPQRLLGLAALVLFLQAPLYRGCNGAHLIRSYGDDVKRHAFENPLLAFDQTASPAARIAAQNDWAQRGILLILLLVPVAGVALGLVPRGRWPRAAALAALPGTAAAAATLLNAALGLINWQPDTPSPDLRVLIWVLWALPSGVPLFVLPAALFGVAKRRPWARRATLAIAALAVLSAVAAPLRRGHSCEPAAYVVTVLLGVALGLEARGLPIEAPAPEHEGA